jgi:tRNA (cmo5U34)-methyltransferase
MNDFDLKAAGWDLNPVHIERSLALVKEIKKHIKLNRNMRAMEFGAGTGIVGFLLRDELKEIVMIDTSEGMVNKMNEKIASSGASNLKALIFDLEKEKWEDGKFDLILTQMVLHHVPDIRAILARFRSLLNPGGSVAIADLYSEDGSFHGEGFTGQNGFDTKKLKSDIKDAGFSEITEEKFFEMKKELPDGSIRYYDIFLINASLKK